LSLTVASEASLASTAPALDTMTRNAGVSHEITLREEEVCDISLAAFHVFDKEGLNPSRLGNGASLLVGPVACSRVWRGKPRKAMPIHPQLPIRPRRRVRLGRRTGQFGKSDKTLLRACEEKSIAAHGEMRLGSPQKKI
jgi:hypothetical protein